MSALHIALVGYGKMGVLIEKIALEAGHRCVSIDPHAPGANFTELNDESLKDVDVVIDFSHPNAALSNFDNLISRKVPVVAGVTGWYEEAESVKKKVLEADSSFLYAGNFSLGVQLFFKLISQAAALFNPFSEYDVAGYEVHHNQKADSPSGTAETIIERLLEGIDRKTAALCDSPSRRIEAHELSFPSLRVGQVPGTHAVSFDSSVDSIELIHRARNREGFAVGAVKAAEWLVGKKGFFTVDDLIEDLL